MTAMLGAKARFLLHSGAAGSAPRLHRGKNALKKEKYYHANTLA